MSNDLVFNVRLNADGSGLVGQLKLSKAEVDKLTQATNASTAAKRSETDATGKSNQSKREAAAAAKAAAAALKEEAQAELNLAEIRKAVALQARQNILDQQSALRQNAMGMQQLGMQFADFTQQVSMAASPQGVLFAFAQQANQAAYAASQMGGVAGRVGAFLAGPWGALITAGVTVLGMQLIPALLDTDKAATAAEEALDSFAKHQADIKNYIDATTGALREQNTTMLANARLEREKKQRDNTATARELSDAAFAKARAAANPGTNGSMFAMFGAASAPGPVQIVDPAIAAVLQRAGNDVEKLDRGLQALMSRRPDLRGLILDVSNAAATAVKAKRDNEQLGLEIRALNGDTTALAQGNAQLIEKQVELETATTDLERARAKLSLVQMQGSAAEKAGGAALQKYRTDLTAAQRAVNAAEAAERQARESRTALTRATRDAAQAAKELASENAGLVAAFAPIQAAADKYLDTLTKIATAQGRGLITTAQAVEAKLNAGLENEAAVIKASRERLGNRNVTFYEDADRAAEATSAAIIKGAEDFVEAGGRAGQRAAERFNSEALQGARAIGDLIGGRLGASVGGLLGLVNGRDEQTKQFTAAADKLFTPVLNKLGVNSSGFAAKAGGMMAGAAMGAQVAGLQKALGLGGSTTGGSIGGALGAATGIPGMDIVGSIAGSVIGGLLKKTKTGSASLSSSGGEISIGDAVGNSSSLRKAASGLAGAGADALQALVDQLGGELGSFNVSIGQRNKKFVVDPTGQNRTKGAGVLSFKDQQEAAEALLADAIKDGALTGVSPRVQSAVQKFADNLNKAVAEGLKVKNLEDLIADQKNPFLAAFRDFERQAEQRIKTARAYGFDVNEIERINGEQRAKIVKETLERATSGIRAVIDKLTIGDLAAGTALDRRATLLRRRDELAAQARAGDTSALESLGSVVEQLLEASRQAGGTARGDLFAADRAGSLDLLNEIVAASERSVKAASDAARKDESAAKLDTTNSQLDELNDQTAGVASDLSAIRAQLGTLLGGADIASAIAASQAIAAGVALSAGGAEGRELAAGANRNL
jgi:hypothetical protein